MDVRTFYGRMAREPAPRCMPGPERARFVLSESSALQPYSDSRLSSSLSNSLEMSCIEAEKSLDRRLSQIRLLYINEILNYYS